MSFDICVKQMVCTPKWTLMMSGPNIIYYINMCPQNMSCFSSLPTLECVHVLHLPTLLRVSVLGSDMLRPFRPTGCVGLLCHRLPVSGGAGGRDDVGGAKEDHNGHRKATCGRCIGNGFGADFHFDMNQKKD